jgi:phosphatidylinositol-3-phosphatase
LRTRLPISKFNEVISMPSKAIALTLAAGVLSAVGFAQQNARPTGIPHLDHVFLIMMENHGYQQVIDNSNEPYLNSLIANRRVNLATNYFAVGHPSLTNYLEVVGGSNFGVRSDNAPDWGSTSCTPNIASGVVNADNGGGNAPMPVESGNVCPITGSGTDAATPAVDTWNEVGGPFVALADLDGVKSVPAASTVGATIADQLDAVGLEWKSYQESLPEGSISGVNYSNGTATNLTNFTNLAPLTSSNVVQLYAVKHNPFAYFKSIQDGYDKDSSLKNVVGFDGPQGLFADLASGDMPSFAFIAPNQCNDQHGRGNGDAFCAFDYGMNDSGYTYGTQVGLNPGLIQQGDTAIERLVKAIHASRAWRDGRNAIVIVWDENDYSGSTTVLTGAYPLQNQNRVVLTVDTNYSDQKGVQSDKYYNSFSLLKSLEAAFRLSCLNHACDPDVNVMSDLFAGNGDHGRF